MAEIKVERKRGIPLWALLMALTVVALLVWAYVRSHHRPTVPDTVVLLELSAPAQGSFSSRLIAVS